MATPRFAILDPSSGISGDMLLGALIDAGAPAAWLQELPARLGFPDVRVEIHRTDRCGIACTKVDVRLANGDMELPHDVVAAPLLAHSHTHSHPHPHGHPTHEPRAIGAPAHLGHRRLGDLVAAVERAPLSPWVRERAIAAFRLLGEAEGRLHGVPAEAVELHELGAIDAIVDIVGGIEGFERLGIRRIHHWPLALGSGWVRAAHGTLPVPAPATAMLVDGLEIRESGPVVGEATTPTGAVLLRVLSSGAPPERWRAVGAPGWGAGGRNPEGYPNALRLLLAEGAEETGDLSVLVTDVDDLSPEYLEPLREALLAAGALDVQVWTTQAKKGRVGFRIEALVAPATADHVASTLFVHSTTAGLRRWRAERVTLPRHEMLVEAGGGMSVRVKVLESPNGPKAKPEFDDVTLVAARTGRPAIEVAAEMQREALHRLGANGG
ncbi:MAG: nickel pincer cofactor biosynthesis protein LarC, partial [Gemmatimonadales bacterium]|nr:nickel pincer cofactor biosynthesis protein LarC [Gemmatimonadales bacterium]